MSDSPLVIEHEFHEPGEYLFTPGRLTLSVALGRTPVEMRYDGKYWQGTSVHGDVKVMPVGQERLFQHSVGCRFACITIDEDKVLEESSYRITRPYGVLRDAPMRHLLDALRANAEQGPPGSLFEDAVGRAIVARLQALDGWRDRVPVQRLSPLARKRVLDYIEAKLAEDISVTQLARVAGLSTAHFATLFHNTLGEPPHRFVVRLRVERARELLLAGVDPSHAAVAVGFYDHSHLARHMRRVLGISPSVLRPPKRSS